MLQCLILFFSNLGSSTEFHLDSPQGVKWVVFIGVPGHVLIPNLIFR